MKNLSLNRAGLALGLAFGVGLALPAGAEELLWKATNTQPAMMVPSYPGSGSPFPLAAVKPETLESGDSEEQLRLREEALATASKLVASGRALQPDMRNITVGGVVEGNLGPRVLINNQWLGVGEKLTVRQYKTRQVQEALKALSAVDPGSAQQLADSVEAKLTAAPTLALTVQKITSQTVSLKSVYGVQDIKMNNF